MKTNLTKTASAIVGMLALLCGSLNAATAEYGNITVDTRAILQGNVEVRVMDGATGALLSGAAVTVAGQSQNTINGVATFNNLPSATYTFGVMMAGYASVDQQVPVPAGATRVVAIPVFTGTSLDQPQIPNAASQVIRDVATSGSKRLMLLTTYKLHGTAPDYSVVLQYRRGNTGLWQAIPTANLRDYGTQAPNWGASVKPGQHQALWDVAIDLPNTLEPMLQVQIIATRNGRSAVKETQFLSLDTRSVVTSTLSGRIVKAGGIPVSGATVQLMPHQKSVVTGADGTFSLTELNPAAGCNLRVSATGYQPFLKNPLAVPVNTLNLGDLTLVPEVRVMRLRPLPQNPNLSLLRIPAGGTGYLYWQVMTEDGKYPCPGQTVQLEITGGSLIPQSATPRENWAGPLAGLSDKDGIVRLEVPTSAIGGVAGAIVNVRVRPSATLDPDTENFPGASAFGATVEVVPREWEQVRELGIEKEAAAKLYKVVEAGIKLEDTVEQRMVYRGSQLAGEKVSSSAVEAIGVGLGLSAPGVTLGGEIGAGLEAGISTRADYFFPAPGGSLVNPPLGNVFKVCQALRGQLQTGLPFIGAPILEVANEVIWPQMSNYRDEVEIGMFGGAGASLSVNAGISGLANDTTTTILSLNGAVEAYAAQQMSLAVRTGNGWNSDPSVYQWNGTTANFSGTGGASFRILNFSDKPFPGNRIPGSAHMASPGLSAGISLNRTFGIRYFPAPGGGAKRVEIVNDRGYTDPGSGADFSETFGTESFPTAEPVTQGLETRQFVTVRSVERRDGGSMRQFDTSRKVVNSEVAEIWADLIGSLSIQDPYVVSYERRMAVGRANPELKFPIDLVVAEISLATIGKQEAEAVVEQGRIWRNRELPLWTLAAPQKAEIPTTGMAAVLANWSLAGGGELVDLVNERIVKTTTQKVGHAISVIKRKVQQVFPSNNRVPKGGPQETPPPPSEEGWENYGISGLYELTSETPITTPIPLVMSYTTEDLGGGNAADLGAYYFVPESSNWEKLPASLDSVAMTLTVNATREGYYGLALPQPAGEIPLMLEAVPPLAADGLTTATIRVSGLVLNNGSPVPDGTLYTVSTQGVSVTGEDASGTLDGFQIQSASGTLAIGIRTPVGGVDALVSVESAGIGTAKGTLEFGLRDTTPPNAPVSTGVSAGTSGLRASWTRPDATDISGYRVYYKQGVAGPPWDGVSAVEGNASPIFTDELFADIKGLVPGANYHLAVSAVDTTGNESPLGTVFSVSLQAGPPAPVPSATAIRGADGQVFLSWGLSPDDLLGQRNVDHYEIRRRLPGNTWEGIGTTESGQNNYGDTWPAGLTANEYPEYTIVPVSSNGATGQSVESVFDSDSDTMPDQWESANGLNPQNPNDATANGDGDLRNNLEEYIAGSFPGRFDGTDFQITQFGTESSSNGSRLADAGTVRLSWNAAANLAADENYVVEASQTLAVGSWQSVVNAKITVVNRTGVAVVTRHADRPCEFYRISLSRGTGDSSYASWIRGFPAIIESERAAISDPDRDGISNAVEMVLGGHPSGMMDAALLPIIESVKDPGGAIPAGEYVVFSYRRTDETLDRSIASLVEYNSDLSGSWTEAEQGREGVQVVESDDHYGRGVDRVQVYIPRQAKQKLFVRLKVLVPQ